MFEGIAACAASRKFSKISNEALSSERHFRGRQYMTNIQPEPLSQETEVLYWLDLAKRILGSELTPDEAQLALKSSVPYVAASDVRNGPTP